MGITYLMKGEQLYFASIYDFPFQALAVEKQEIIREGFPGYFRSQIFPLIDPNKIHLLYNPSENGRPGTAYLFAAAARLYCTLSGIDESYFMEHIHFDPALQYALGLETAHHIPFSKNTFQRFDEALDKYEAITGHDIWDECTHYIDLALAEDMKLTSDFGRGFDIAMRLDTFMMEGHGAYMTRLQIVYTCNFMAIKAMVSLGVYDYIPVGTTHYINDGDHNKMLYFKGKLSEVAALNLEQSGKAYNPGSTDKANQSEQEKRKATIGSARLYELVRESVEIRAAMEQADMVELDEYRILTRMIDDQTKLDSDGVTIIPKNSSEIKGSSMQNPYDEDKTYRNKNHQGFWGYSALVGEVYDDEGNGIITVRELEPNVVSDQEMIRHLYQTMDGSQKIAMSVDAGFTSAELDALANQKNVTVFCGGVTGKTPDPIMASFVLGEDKRSIVQCPKGYEPDSPCEFNEKNEKIRSHFCAGTCSQCEYAKACDARILKDSSATVYVTQSQVFAAQRIVNMHDSNYHALVNKRNAVEGIPSVMRRKYRIDEVTAFGINRARRYFYTAVTAYNITKHYAYYCEQKVPKIIEITA